MNYYSPHTGEHINTDTPAPWMGSTELAVPAYDKAAQGAFFVNGAWAVVTTMPEEPAVPRAVTMRQARLALLGAGLLASVDAAINGLPSPQKEAARIEWEYSQEVQRHNGFVSVLAPSLGLTDAQTDALFIAAAGL